MTPFTEKKEQKHPQLELIIKEEEVTPLASLPAYLWVMFTAGRSPLYCTVLSKLKRMRHISARTEDMTHSLHAFMPR